MTKRELNKNTQTHDPKAVKKQSLSNVESKNNGLAPLKSGGKWWQGRLMLSTILAISLCTYFVVSSTTAASNHPENTPDEGAHINIVFPTIPLMAVAICWFSDLMIWILQTDTFDRKNPVASVLVGTLVRTMVILGALGFSSATKWPAHKDRKSVV